MIGDGFKGGWLDQSLNKLCDHGRVFQGNNLYSLGACYCLKQLLEPTPVLEEHVFLGKQDIRFDIGLFSKQQGMWDEDNQPQYIPIFEHGSSWDACHKTLYLIPEGEQEIVIKAKALGEKEARTIRVDLRELPQKQNGAGKWKLTLAFTDVQIMEITVEDVGLGQVVPGSGKVVSTTIRF